MATRFVRANTNPPQWLRAVVHRLNALIWRTGYVVYIMKRAKRISLGLPTVTKNGKHMANFELLNDEVVTIPILTDDAGGDPVPAPAGDTFSVVSSNPASLNAVIGTTSAGNPAVVINALVQQSPGLTIVVSDSAGLSAFTQIVDIVADTTPKAITLDIADATEVSQPTPTNPGP